MGRARLLSEAKQFIAGLSDNLGIDVWQALLGACSIHGDSKMGKYATDQLFWAELESPTPYILLSNIYSIEGRWKERARTIKRTSRKPVQCTENFFIYYREKYYFYFKNSNGKAKSCLFLTNS